MSRLELISLCLSRSIYSASRASASSATATSTESWSLSRMATSFRGHGGRLLRGPGHGQTGHCHRG